MATAGTDPRHLVTRARRRLRLRRRFRSGEAVKHESELRWWLTTWEPTIRAGGFSPPDALALLDGEPAGATYEERRWQQARAEVVRVAREADLEGPAFFEGKAVVDVGSGPLGFVDACPARVRIAIEPVADAYAEHGLLLRSDAVYLTAGAEAMPLVTGSADVVLARNSLDHVDDPARAIAEARRVLRPGGTLILNFDVGGTPTETEPHALSADLVKGWLGPMELVHEDTWDHGHGRDGHAVVLVAREPR